jgi:hypothetical protein
MYVSFETEDTVIVKPYPPTVIAIAVAVAVATTFKVLYLGACYTLLPTCVRVSFRIIIEDSKWILIAA